MRKKSTECCGQDERQSDWCFIEPGHNRYQKQADREEDRKGWKGQKRTNKQGSGAAGIGNNSNDRLCEQETEPLRIHVYILFIIHIIHQFVLHHIAVPNLRKRDLKKVSFGQIPQLIMENKCVTIYQQNFHLVCIFMYKYYHSQLPAIFDNMFIV